MRTLNLHHLSSIPPRRRFLTEASLRQNLRRVLIGVSPAGTVQGGVGTPGAAINLGEAFITEGPITQLQSARTSRGSIAVSGGCWLLVELYSLVPTIFLPIRLLTNVLSLFDAIL